MQASLLHRYMHSKKFISAKYALDNVALVLDDFHDLRDILLAGIMVRSFHHHADNRLGAGLTHQNTASITRYFCYYISIFHNGRFDFAFSASIEVTFYIFKHSTKHNRYYKRQAHSKPAVKINRKFSHYNIAISNYKLMC